MALKKGLDKMAAQNAAKTLFANIRFASIDKPIKTVTVTSSRPNEGKTTVAHFLANAAATSGRRALIVECDMRNRSVAAELGVQGAHGSRGLYAVLSGKATLAEAITPTHQKTLDFLDVEPGIPNPSDVLATKRFRKLVRDLRQGYDFVIFDTPPVGSFVDAAELAALTDATIFVVRENFTNRDLALNALDQLRKAGGNVIGTVLNYCEATTNGYYDYYGHYGYGQDQDKGSERAGAPSHEGRSHHARQEAAAAVEAPEPAAADPVVFEEPEPSFVPVVEEPATVASVAASVPVIGTGASSASAVQAPVSNYGTPSASTKGARRIAGAYVPAKNNPYAR